MLGAIIGAAGASASGSAPVAPWVPAPTNKAATLYSVTPETVWAPVARGITMPPGNRYDALSPGLIFNTGTYNPGLFGSETGFLIAVIDSPFDAMNDNDRCYLFGNGNGFNVRLNGPFALNPHQMNYSWSGAGMTPSSGSLAINRSPTVDRMLVALTRNGGTLTFTALNLDTSAVINTASIALTGTRSNNLTSIMLGAVNTTLGVDQFQGQFGLFISGRGVTPALTDLQAIALGANAHTVLSGLGTPSYECYTDFSALCTTIPGTIAPPAGITATSAGAVATGTDMFAGDTIRRQSTAVYLKPLMTWRWGQIHGITPVQSTGSATVTVEASAGVTPQFRAATRAGAVLQDWTTMTSAGGGVFTGALATGWYSDWGVLEFRNSADPTNLLTRALYTKPHAIGPKLVAIGQSQIANNGFSTTARGDVLPQALRGKAVFQVRPTATVAGSNSIITPGYSNVSDGIVRFVEQWFDAGGGPFSIMNNSVGATGAVATLNDGLTARPIAVEQATATYTGTDRATIIWQWVTADGPDIATFGADYFNAVMFGDPAAVAACGYSTALETSHYCARDAAGGLWGADAYIVMSPPTRHQEPSTAAPTYVTSGLQWSNARKNAVAWAAAEGFVSGPYIDDMMLKDQYHQDDTAAKGNPLFGARMAQAALRAFGLYPDADPTITSIVLTEPNVYTVSFSLPNGGSLYCPAPTAVTGFEVNNSGNPATFSAQVVGSKVRLTKLSGNWTGSETITYCAGYPRSYVSLTGQQAMVDGTLYESSASDILGLGIPVAPYGL